MTEPTPAWESDEGLLMLVQDALNAPDAVPTFDNLGVESFLFYVAGRA